LTTKKTIYLIRHGQTDYNLQGIIQGQGIDSDLNEKGRRQAKSFFDKYQHIQFDRVYTSTLKRTQQSVASFIEMGIDHVVHRGFDEINWGIHEGQKATEEHREIFHNITKRWSLGEVDFAPEGGESPAQMQARQVEGLELLKKDENEKRVLVCMHGRALRSFLCLLLEYPLAQMDDFPHTNLCLYKLSLTHNGSVELLEQNNVAHLNDAIRSNFP